MADTRIDDGLESPRVAGTPFALTAIGVLIFIGISVGVLWAVFTSAVPNRLPAPAQRPPAPRLLAHPPTELQAVWKAQRARLEGYHWVDRANKVASIPIDRAMAIIAARGKDAYAPIPGAPSAPAPQVPELLQGLTHAPSAPLSAKPGAPP